MVQFSGFGFRVSGFGFQFQGLGSEECLEGDGEEVPETRVEEKLPHEYRLEHLAQEGLGF